MRLQTLNWVDVSKKLLLIIFLYPLISISQEKTNVHFSIDSLVDNINVISKGKTKTYTRHKTSNGHRMKEEWEYFDNNKLSKISIEYKIDSTKYTERYYLRNGVLIYASEGIKYLFPSLGPNDYTIWSGDFYFVKEKLDYYVTLGHGKSELDNWEPEKENLQRFKKRKAELALLKQRLHPIRNLHFMFQ